MSVWLREGGAVALAALTALAAAVRTSAGTP